MRVLLFFALSLMIAGAAIAGVFEGEARVIDGDEFELAGKRVRLYGIDAPESGQTCRAEAGEYRCGQEATSALAGKIAQRPVSCTGKDIERYGRIVAVCWLAADQVCADTSLGNSTTP